MTDVHSTAIIAEGAVIGDDVTVGPFCIVGRDVALGDGVRLESNVIITGRTKIGARTAISPFAMVGGEPQDLSYRDEATQVEIGPDCIIREQVTIHRGTVGGRGLTTIGTKCFLMVGVHIAHDCVVGDEVILTNHATLGGHVVLENNVILGGMAGIRQNLRVGAHAFIAAYSGVTRDIIPFAIAMGQPGELAGLNVVGLRRRGFDKAQLHGLRTAYRMFFSSVGPRKERLVAMRGAFEGDEAVGYLADFLEAGGDRPLALPRKGHTENGS
jgi:UDP-N-acetylglucosamine acyltransferase